MSAKVISLHIYPIKSCAGIDMSELSIAKAGPEHDREWMIVDEDGKFLTQRTHPQMARIQPKVIENQLVIIVGEYQFQVSSSDYLQDYETVQVWSSQVRAQVCSNQELSQALSDHLQKKVRLVRYGDQSERESKKSGQGLGAQLRFSDKAPFLITNLASLHDLNQNLSQSVPMTRFRPNIVVEGPMAWSEDRWKSLEFDSFKIEVTQNCGRCPIVNIDQLSGVSPSKEVLAKLATFRKTGNSVDFGVVGVHRGLGTIKVGDSISFGN